MTNFKQKFIDTAYSKFGVKANGMINFEQAFAIIDEIEQCTISDVVVPKGTLCDCDKPKRYYCLRTGGDRCRICKKLL